MQDGALGRWGRLVVSRRIGRNPNNDDLLLASLTIRGKAHCAIDASEEGLLDPERCIHVGLRGGIYDKAELESDEVLAFQIVRADYYEAQGSARIVERIRHRVSGGPAYISVDIDVLDPSHAPATGTPEVAGLTTRELFATLRGLTGIGVVGADIVEVAHAYDHASLTGLAAAHTAWEVLSIMAYEKQHYGN